MFLDHQEIHQLSHRREEENLRFRSFLKGQNSARIDRMVHQLYSSVSKEIDCTQCGYCCTQLRPVIMEIDIDLLTKTLKLSREKFKKKFIILDDEGDMLLKHLPCKFLKNQKCTVYESRPRDCQSYPHLHKSDITSRLYVILENYGICPIVFNVIEELKIRLNFR